MPQRVPVRVMLGAALAAAGVVTCMVVPAARAADATAEAPAPERLDWRPSIDAAMAEAKESGRLPLVYFHADWCQPCRWMRGGAFGLPKMVAYLERYFAPVKIDDTKGASAVSQAYGVRLYPTVVVLDVAGKVLHVMAGPRTPPAFHAELERVRALPALKAAARLAPDDVEANFQVAAALADLKHLEAAAPYLEKVVALDPKGRKGRLEQATLLLAVVPLEGGDADAALEKLDAWLARFAESAYVPKAMYLQGTVLFRDLRLKAAREVFDALRERFPTHEKAYEADKAIEAIDERLRVGGQAWDKAKDGLPPAPKEPAPEPTPQPKG